MDFEVIIIGGSYAGLSAATSLGRALRKVLVIDGGKPCNRQTPYSHNFLTNDGETPSAIIKKATEQLKAYKTITLLSDIAIDASKTENGFEVLTSAGKIFTAGKLLFATGITDVLPDIDGFAECWGISVLHCPYCHGYEVRHQPTGILGNGEAIAEYVKLISNWTKDITLFTNGKATLTDEQLQELRSGKIKIEEGSVKHLVQESGKIKSIVLQDGSSFNINALYARLPFTQHSNLPQQLGCTITDEGYIHVDSFYRTSTPGIYAAGDNSAFMRSVAVAVASGTAAGAVINRDMVIEAF
jgi:thioredoxin reductase